MTDYIRYNELENLGVPYSRMHIHRLIAANQFPKPVKFAPGPRGAVRFLRAEVESWVKEKPRVERYAA